MWNNNSRRAPPPLNAQALGVEENEAPQESIQVPRTPVTTRCTSPSNNKDQPCWQGITYENSVSVVDNEFNMDWYYSEGMDMERLPVTSPQSDLPSFGFFPPEEDEIEINENGRITIVSNLTVRRREAREAAEEERKRREAEEKKQKADQVTKPKKK